MGKSRLKLQRSRAPESRPSRGGSGRSARCGIGLCQPGFQARLHLTRQKSSPNRGLIALEKVRFNPCECLLQLPVFAVESGSGHGARIRIHAQWYSGAIQSIHRMMLETLVHARLHITAGANLQMDLTFLELRD